MLEKQPAVLLARLVACALKLFFFFFFPWHSRSLASKSRWALAWRGLVFQEQAGIPGCRPCAWPQASLGQALPSAAPLLFFWLCFVPLLDLGAIIKTKYEDRSMIPHGELTQQLS